MATPLVSSQSSTPPPASSSPPNFDREHYNHLVGTIKFIVGFAATALTLIVGVATFFTYKSVRELNDDAKNTVSDVKKDMKETKDEYSTAIKDAKKDAADKLDALNKQVEIRIAQIKDEAELAAKATVNKTLREQFESSNIRNLISQTADDRLKGQVGSILDQKVKERTKDMEEQTVELARLTLAGDQITRGDRKYLVTVDSIAKFHRLLMIRNLAIQLLTQKKADYKARFSFEKNINSRNPEVFIPYENIDTSFSNKEITGLDSVIKIIVKYIAFKRDLSHLTCEFITLNKITGKYFELFDFESVSNWYKNEYHRTSLNLQEYYNKRNIIVSRGLGYLEDNWNFPEIR